MSTSDEASHGEPGEGWLAEIGKLALLGAHVENEALGLANGVEGTSHLGKRFWQLRDVIMANVDALSTERGASELAAPILRWCADARVFMDHRNRLLHASWMFYPTSSPLLLKLRDYETETVAPEKLLKYVAMGEELTSRGGDLTWELMFRNGELDGMLQAMENGELAEDGNSE